MGSGQQWAEAITKVATRLKANNNTIQILWVPAHSGAEGNGVADGTAKEAAESARHAVPDEIRLQTNLPHLSRRATENKAGAASQWAKGHIRPERKHYPLGGSGLRHSLLRKVRKTTAQRYYQLLFGHAAIGSFLHDRMAGPQRLASDKCWWCNCDKKEIRHHVFTECKTWTTQIRRLWKRVGKDCNWKHPRAPSVRRLWKEDATAAVLEFLEDTPVGFRSSGMVRPKVDEREGRSQKMERVGQAHPRLHTLLLFFSRSLSFFFSFLLLSLSFFLLFHLLSFFPLSGGSRV